MIDVVLDLELDDWLEQERERAHASAAQQIRHAEWTVAMVKHTYGQGDEALELGDETNAAKLWYVAAVLNPAREPPELVEGEWS